MAVSLTGQDIIKINDRIITDLADGDVVNITFPNNISELKTGKNGNSIFSQNLTGENAEVVIRVIRGSADDKYLLTEMLKQKNDFSKFSLLTGEFIKRVGDGEGNIISDIYVLTGGIFYKNVEAKTNVEGDTEQSISIYNIKFAKVLRIMQ